MVNGYPENGQLILEQAGIRDLEALHRLLAGQFAEHEIAMPPDRLRQAIAEFLQDDRWGLILAARQAGEIIGVACVSFAFTLEHGGRSAWLDELYVTPGRRGQGAGTALLKSAMQAAREKGCVAMDLEVEHAHRYAERLYARAGFQPLARSRWARKL